MRPDRIPSGGITAATMLFAVVETWRAPRHQARSMEHGHATGPGKWRNIVNMIYRIFRWFAAIALVCTAGILPSCASMGGGGGGMKYVVSDPIPMEQSRSM